VAAGGDWRALFQRAAAQIRAGVVDACGLAAGAVAALAAAAALCAAAARRTPVQADAAIGVVDAAIDRLVQTRILVSRIDIVAGLIAGLLVHHLVGIEIVVAG
jgi:hypothetical protein